MILNWSVLGMLIIIVYWIYTIYLLKKNHIVIQQKELKNKLKKSNKMSFRQKRRQKQSVRDKMAILKIIVLYMVIVFVITRAVTWEYPIVGSIIVIILIYMFVRFTFVQSNKLNQLLLKDEDVTYREMAKNAVYIISELKVPVIISTVILCVSIFLSMMS